MILNIFSRILRIVCPIILFIIFLICLPLLKFTHILRVCIKLINTWKQRPCKQLCLEFRDTDILQNIFLSPYFFMCLRIEMDYYHWNSIINCFLKIIIFHIRIVKDPTFLS